MTMHEYRRAVRYAVYLRQIGRDASAVKRSVDSLYTAAFDAVYDGVGSQRARDFACMYFVEGWDRDIAAQKSGISRRRSYEILRRLRDAEF